jgi:hypothetical protein
MKRVKEIILLRFVWLNLRLYQHVLVDIGREEAAG